MENKAFGQCRGGAAMVDIVWYSSGGSVENERNAVLFLRSHKKQRCED